MSKEALEGSIKKWERIVKRTSAIDDGLANCPLCQKYPDLRCTGCPVADKTEKDGCLGSPYDEWNLHLKQAHSRSCGNREPYCKECLRLAKAELVFLRSLRRVYK